MLKDLVDAKLCDDWSPEQISGWLKLTYPDNDGLRVSPETIYKSLFVQTRGLLRKEQRWSRKFGPVVKVDHMTKEVIQNEETKEPFARV